jgi:hypothetical protein
VRFSLRHRFGGGGEKASMTHKWKTTGKVKIKYEKQHKEK